MEQKSYQEVFSKARQSTGCWQRFLANSFEYMPDGEQTMRQESVKVRLEPKLLFFNCWRRLLVEARCCETLVGCWDRDPEA